MAKINANKAQHSIQSKKKRSFNDQILTTRDDYLMETSRKKLGLRYEPLRHVT